MHHHTERSFVDEFRCVSPLHYLKNGWQTLFFCGACCKRGRHLYTTNAPSCCIPASYCHLKATLQTMSIIVVNLQDNRSVFRIFIALLKSSFHSPSYPLECWPIRHRLTQYTLYILHPMTYKHIKCFGLAQTIIRCTNTKILTWGKVKVKCTPVQALRLCTGRTAHRGSRGIALPFIDNGTRRGWGVSVTPRPFFTPEKDPVPTVEEAGWAPGSVWTGAENLAPLEFDFRTVQLVASR